MVIGASVMGPPSCSVNQRSQVSGHGFVQRQIFVGQTQKCTKLESYFQVYCVPPWAVLRMPTGDAFRGLN